MKLKKYEKMEAFSIICILNFIMVIFLFSFLTIQKFPVFRPFSGVVQKENIVLIVVSQEDLKLFYRNRYLYIHNKKVLFRREKIVKNVLNREKKYHQLYLRFSFDSKYKDGDIINFSIEKNKIRGIEMFQLIWKGD